MQKDRNERFRRQDTITLKDIGFTVQERKATPIQEDIMLKCDDTNEHKYHIDIKSVQIHRHKDTRARAHAHMQTHTSTFTHEHIQKEHMGIERQEDFTNMIYIHYMLYMVIICYIFSSYIYHMHASYIYITHTHRTYNMCIHHIHVHYTHSSALTYSSGRIYAHYTHTAHVHIHAYIQTIHTHVH